jgi:sulfonate transport system ATP-binding protein
VSALQRREAGARVVVERLEKRFGDRAVLRGIDLEIAPGEFLAVVGRSGCGKSTLLRVLSALEQPSAGSARVLRDDPEQRRADVRVVFQEPRLLPWKSVLDNVCIGEKPSTAPRGREVLASVGMDGRASEYPGVLSGGQRQRVALARALLHSPAVLLLDEPFGALDALTRIEAQRLVERLWIQRGFTAVLVTHDVGEAVLLADRVVVVQNGRIAESFTVDVERPRRREHPDVARISAAVLDKIFDASPERNSTERVITRSGDYPLGLYTEKAVSHGTL